MRTCKTAGCTEPTLPQRRVCRKCRNVQLAQSKVRRHGRRDKTAVGEEVSRLPEKPAGTCIYGVCMSHRLPGDVLCARHREYFLQSTRPSGYGETPQAELEASMAFNRLVEEAS